MNEKYRDLETIFQAGLQRVNPYAMIRERFILEGNSIRIRNDRSDEVFDLSRFSSVLVFGAGKATAKMALAVEEILGDKITKGLISVKPGHTEKLTRIEMVEAGHPVPDQGSINAARAIEKMARGATGETLVINLISGGGSALLSSPLDFHDDAGSLTLTLGDKQETTKALLSSGATIQEINCIRKHLSNIKGGRLAALMYPATSINLILSDVVGDRLDSIASGLTAPDRTTYGDALSIVDKYKIADKLPAPVIEALKAGAAGRIPETPAAGDPVFEKVHNILIGTNFSALLAAEAEARSLGYNTRILTSSLTGEAREAAKFFYAIARDTAKHSLIAEKPACIIAGGETTVTIRGKGLGGRNQEMALAFLECIENDTEPDESIFFISSATDGNDGPTDAAGAFASLGILREAETAGLSVRKYLEANDSYHFFEKIGRLTKTGATNTNVCDLQIMIVT